MFLLSTLLHGAPNQMGVQIYSTEMYIIVAAAFFYVLLLIGVQAARDGERNESCDE